MVAGAADVDVGDLRDQHAGSLGLRGGDVLEAEAGGFPAGQRRDGVVEDVAAGELVDRAEGGTCAVDLFGPAQKCRRVRL